MLVSEETIAAIRSQINENARFANAIKADICGPHPLWLAVTARELFNELNFLDRLLTYPSEQIAVEFKKRCKQRQTSSNEFISIADNPETHTNRLYFNVAKLIFNPVDLEELLAVLMPKTKRCISIKPFTTSTTPTTAKALKEYVDNADVTLQESDMSFFKGLPFTDESLSECVFSDNVVFPLALSLPETPTLNWYVKWFRALESYPALKLKIELHNEGFQTLALHVQQAKKGLNAKGIFNALIQGLREVGTRVHGQPLADPSIINITTHFFEDFDSLPEAVRNQVKALPVRGSTVFFKTLGDLLNSLDDFRTCVEATANALENTLQPYKEKPLLNARQFATEKLTLYYQTTSLSTLKNTTHARTFPLTITLELFKFLQLKSGEHLLWLLRELPLMAYSPLLQSLQQSHDDISDSMIELDIACRNNLLTIEQKKALLSTVLTLTKDFLSIRTVETLVKGLFKALSSDTDDTDDTELQRVLTTQPSVTKTRNFLYFLDYLGGTSAIRVEALTLLPLDTRIDYELDELSDHRKCPRPIDFYLLSKLSIEDLQAVFFTSNESPARIVRILENERQSEKRLRILLELVKIHNTPIEQFVDSNKRNILHYIAEYAVAPLYIICVLTPSQQQSLATQRDSNGLVPLALTKTFNRFIAVLSCQPQEMRLSHLIDENLELRDTYTARLSGNAEEKLVVIQGKKGTVAVMTPMVPGSEAFYIDTLLSLAALNQIVFLRAFYNKFNTITSAAKCFIKDSLNAKVKHYIYSPVLDLLRLLSDPMLKNSIELEKIALSQTSWEGIQQTLKSLLKNELVTSHYISKRYKNLESLQAFYKRNYITLTLDECFLLIRDLSKMPPSFNTIRSLELLLSWVHELKNTIRNLEELLSWGHELKNTIPWMDLLTSENYLLLDIIFAQSFLPTRSHGIIFNPVILYRLYDWLKHEPLSQDALSRFLKLTVPRGHPYYCGISIQELIIEGFFHLSDVLIISPEIANKTLNLFLKSHYDERLIALKNAKHNHEAARQVLVNYLNSSIKNLEFKNYTKLLELYLKLLALVEAYPDEKYESVREVLRFKMGELLHDLTPLERLLLLNYKPRGMIDSLNTMLRPVTQYPALMREQVEILRIKEHILSTIRAYQNFENYDGIHSYCQAGILAIDNKNKIGHLERVSNLCLTVLYVEEVKVALKETIDRFIDSDAEDLLTVKSHPNLGSHAFLYRLIAAVLGPQHIPDKKALCKNVVPNSMLFFSPAKEGRQPSPSNTIGHLAP